MVKGIIGRKVGMTQLFAADGTVTPVGNGSTTIVAAVGGRSARATVSVENVEKDEPWSFRNHVEPVLGLDDARIAVAGEYDEQAVERQQQREVQRSLLRGMSDQEPDRCERSVEQPYLRDHAHLYPARDAEDGRSADRRRDQIDHAARGERADIHGDRTRARDMSRQHQHRGRPDGVPRVRDRGERLFRLGTARRSLHERRLPPGAFDREGMLRTYDRLAALEAGGARLYYGHDPEFWATVPQAPATIT